MFVLNVDEWKLMSFNWFGSWRFYLFYKYRKWSVESVFNNKVEGLSKERVLVKNRLIVWGFKGKKVSFKIGKVG